MITRVKQVKTLEELTQAFTIRKAVFVKEQGISEKLDFDTYDPQAFHILVYAGEDPIATGRLHMENKQGHISRIAVLKEFRGKGLGRLVVENMEKLAIEKGMTSVFLYPHDYLKKFYTDLGYCEVPDSKFWLGKHTLIKMTKNL